jgi:hypothetical protein
MREPEQPARSGPDTAKTPAENGTSFSGSSADPGRTSGPLVLLATGLLGGVLAWQLMQPFDTYFRIPRLPEEMRNVNPSYSPEVKARMRQNERHALLRNTALGIGLFGLCVGALLGLAEGIARKSAGVGMLGLLMGGIVGLAFGVGGGLAGAFTRFALQDGTELNKTFQTIATHAVIWGVVGTGMGLAATVVAREPRRMRRAACASVAAGLIAAFLYSPLAAIWFPAFRSELPIPEGYWNRLFFAALASGLMGLAIGRARTASLPTPVRSAAL